MSRKNSIRRNQKVRTKKKKLVLQVGGTIEESLLKVLQNRSNVYEENLDQTIFEKINTESGPRQLQIRISESGSEINLGKEDIQNLSSIKELRNNSQITFIPTHGSHKNLDEDNRVPYNTIICFLGVMGEFTSDRNKYTNFDDTHILRFFNKMDTGTFHDILTYRNLYNKENEIVTPDLYYDAFRCSTWYYPDDLYPDIELSVGPEDINVKNNFDPINLSIKSNSPDTDRCNKELCGSDLFGEDFPNSEFGNSARKAMGYKINLKDGLIKLKSVLGGFRLVVLTACRDMYDISYINGKKMLERELYFYHFNYNLDKTIIDRERPTRRNVKICWNSTSSMRKILINKPKSYDFSFSKLNSNNNIHFYNGRTGSLIPLKEKAKTELLDNNELMYLSTFSLHKIILFLNKLKAPDNGLKSKFKSLFSSCMSTSTHTKWMWNNTNNFITFCIANSNKINYLMTKIENMILYLSKTISGLDLVTANSSNIIQMMEDIKFILTIISPSKIIGARAKLSRMSRIFYRLERENKKIFKDLTSNEKYDTLIRIKVSRDGKITDYYGNQIKEKLEKIDPSKVSYIEFNEWNIGDDQIITRFINLQTIYIDNCKTLINLNWTPSTPLHIFITRYNSTEHLRLYGNISILEIENTNMAMVLYFFRMRSLNALKFTDSNLSNINFNSLRNIQITEITIQGGIIPFTQLNDILKFCTNLESIVIQNTEIVGIPPDGGKLNFKLDKLNKKMFIDTEQNNELYLPYGKIFNLYKKALCTLVQGKYYELNIFIEGINNSPDFTLIRQDDKVLFDKFKETGYL